VNMAAEPGDGETFASPAPACAANAIDAAITAAEQNPK